MSWMRPFANILVQGTAVFGRAFLQAYQNAAANAGKTAAGGAQAAVRRGQMTREEALEILGVTAESLRDAPEELEAKYEKFFQANDPSNGGSFYLQSKIYRAKEFLDEEAIAEARRAAGLDPETGEPLDGAEAAAEAGDEVEAGGSWDEASERQADEVDGEKRDDQPRQ